MFKTNKSVLTSMLSASVISSLLMTGCAHTATSTVPAASTIADSRPVVALVLGGGGAKGFAHVGVIKTLEANGIKPDLIVGTSSGSIIGSLYASGLTASQLEKVALDINNSDLTDLTLAHQGIIKGEKLRQFVNRQVRGQSIEDFPIRFAAVAAEKHTLKKTVFNKGEAGIAVQASSSIPKVFIPPRIADPDSSNQVGKKYIDGGVVSIVPVDAAKELGADVVIAVDLQAETANKTNDSNPNKTTVSIESSSLDASVLESTNLFNSTVINQVISDASALLNDSGFLKQGRLLDEDDFWSLIEQGYARYNQADSQAPQSLALQQRYANKLAEIERADVIIRPDVADISAIGSRKKADAIAAGTFAAEQNLDAIKAAIKKAETNYRFALKQ